MFDLSFEMPTGSLQGSGMPTRRYEVRLHGLLNGKTLPNCRGDARKITVSTSLTAVTIIHTPYQYPVIRSHKDHILKGKIRLLRLTSVSPHL